MDSTASYPNRRPPKTSFFLRCFGCDGKRNDNSTNVSGNRRWFRRSKFLLTQTAGTKTFPLDTDHKLHHNSNFMFIKSKLKKKTAGDVRAKPPTPAPIVAKSPRYKNKLNLGKKNIIHNKKARKNEYPTKESFRRKIESIRNASSHPSSPEIKNKSNPIVMLRSISFPINYITRVNTEKSGHEKTNDFDPMVVVSIIMVALVILMIWGRICAILCTSTWLYLVPRLRNSKQEHGQTNGLVFNELEEYMKKRVVLKGFLDRNNNHSSFL